MNERYTDTKKAGFYGIVGNIFLLIIKAVAGVMTKSQAMIADSINSASDIFASLMTFIGNKISSAPKDKTHNLGHGKAEYIFSMFIGISMIILAAKMIFDAATSLIYGNEMIFSWGAIVVCIVTIITKFCLYLYTKKLSKKYKNILLMSNMKDHRNDCVVTTFTLISIILSLFGIYWFDSVVGIAISIWICHTGILIFIESYNVLMDISIDDDTRNKILNLAENFDGVKEVLEVISVPVGYKYVIFMKIAVDGNLTTFDSHALADKLEDDVTKIENIYKTIVHVEPV